MLYMQILWKAVGVSLILFGVATDEKPLDKTINKVIATGYISNVIKIEPNEFQEEYTGNPYE